MNDVVKGLSKDLPKPKNGAGRNLKAAIAVGVSLGALVLAAVFFAPLGWYLLVSVAMAVGTWEVWRRLSEANYVIPGAILVLGGQAMVWASWPFGVGGAVAAFVTAVLALMFSRLFVNGRFVAPTNYLRDTAIGIFVLVWIPLFGSFAAMLSQVKHPTIAPGMFIVTFMLCVIASDVGGYAFGVMFGSHPLAPAVSPKKSLEGFAGSVILGCVAGVACVTLLLHDAWWLGLALGFGLVVCATLGDLVESQFKREIGIKDMSNLLPGHGGLMDRMDGLLPSAMVTWLILSFIGS